MRRFCPRLLYILGLTVLSALPAQAALESVEYGATTLNVQAPAGFSDATVTAEDLFTQIQTESGLDGVALRLYLPNIMAQRHAEGREDAITRQVLLYGAPERARTPLDRKGLDLMAKTMEGAYTAYKKMPEGIPKGSQTQHEFLQAASLEGANVLVDMAPGDASVAFVTLVSYPMGQDASLTTALCTALVLAGDTVVLVTASSIVTDDAPLEHLSWVRATADTFAEMLASANKS